MEKMINDNPKTFWIILKGNIEEFNREVTFNELIKDDETWFHLWKTRKWARKVAKELNQNCLFIYRVIVPVGAEYLQDGKDVRCNSIIIKNDKVYEVD